MDFRQIPGRQLMCEHPVSQAGMRIQPDSLSGSAQYAMWKAASIQCGQLANDNNISKTVKMRLIFIIDALESRTLKFYIRDPGFWHILGGAQIRRKRLK